MSILWKVGFVTKYLKYVPYIHFKSMFTPVKNSENKNM